MQVIPNDFRWEDWSPAREHAKIIRPSSLAGKVVDTFYGDEETKGAHFPWDKTGNKGLRIRDREVTIYSGPRGSYKSLVTGQIALHLMRQDERVLIASFEMRPEQTMHRLTRQATGTDQPSIEWVNRFHKWTDDRLWIYDHLGRCLPHQVEAVCRYATQELGIKHIFIDSLMKCTKEADDRTEQKNFVSSLCAMALEYGVHINLVAHTRKPTAGVNGFDSNDVRGAGEIADQVDNIVMVWRDKHEEEEKKPDANLDTEEKPDVYLKWDKQRNGAYEGKLGFWFNARSLAVVERPNGHWPRIALENE